MKKITIGLLASVGILSAVKVDTVDSVLSDESLKIKRLQDIIDACDNRHSALHDEYIDSCDKHLAEAEALKLKHEADRKELIAKYNKQLEVIDVEVASIDLECTRAKVALARYK